jgi:molybdopterin-guanine dinucleotide biosynthesis protein A
VVGVVLAGGAGSRLGGDKAGRTLAGRPLPAYPAAALAAVCEPVAVVCKPGALAASLEGVELWDDEPEEPRHPAAGIAWALERAGEAVLVCAADMPFVREEDCKLLGDAAAGPASDAGRTAVVATAGDEVQPLFGLYSRTALSALRDGARDGLPMRRVVEHLGTTLVELPAESLRSVNTPDELAAAEAELLSRARARRPGR